MEQSAWKMPDVFSGNTSGLEKAGYPRLLSAMLCARGLETPEDAAAYLSRDRSLISDPFSLSDMDKAVERVDKAISLGESVAVYGDYDVDGITASCLLCDCLERHGLVCCVYIPDRIDEGYGLNPEALESLSKQGVTLVITVDCGITAADNMEFAKGLGLDIIVTDHHECPEKLPDCCAVINPRRQDPEHPAYNLAGVGVALKLACAIEGNTEMTLERYSDLAAIGTIADVMPLTGENRALVHLGLDRLRESPRPGLAALLNEAGAAEKTLTAGVVGYTLAPRINAAGRLCETTKALDLLMCADGENAREYAAELCALNRRRQELETMVWRDAMEELSKAPPKSPIVLGNENWHPGVVGIAASRLAEEYRLPAIIICIDGENGKGSCRSFGSFNLFDALGACREHLDSFGGHAFAAGINIKRANIGAFREALARYYAENTPDALPELQPELRLADFSALTIGDIEALDALEPCGPGNPRPLMCVCGVALEELSAIGGGKHLRMVVSKAGQSVGGVFFSHTPEELSVSQGDIADICFIPQVNEFRFQRSTQLLMAGIRPSEELALCGRILENPDKLPSSSEKTALTRDELGRLWRILRAKGGKVRLRPAELFSDAEFEGMSPVLICYGICVFAELKLLELGYDGRSLDIKMNENGAKAQLESSKLFSALSQKGADEYNG